MFGLKWGESRNGKSQHPLADVAQAAKRLQELPVDNPAKAVREAASWLDSVESEPSFDPAHRLTLVSMIDEAAAASFDELTLAYVGARPGLPGQSGDWRALMEYSDHLSAAYTATVSAYEQQRDAALAPRIPKAIARTMRVISRSMKVSWMRYLPPDRASWEALVQCYRTAHKHGFAKNPVLAYATDADDTCALHELALAIMFTAGTPASLTPRQVEIAYRAALAYRGGFSVNAARDDQWRHYLFDLRDPGAPARIPEQIAMHQGLLFLSAENVIGKLDAVLAGESDVAAENLFGGEFGIAEVRGALEHIRRYWDDNPPSRREERIRINTKIEVELGVPALQRALEAGAPKALVHDAGVTFDGAADSGSDASAASEVVPMNSWTLTDFSARGIGARLTRRLDRWLKVGALVGFRLERSEKWCVAIVRRLRTDSRNQTDVGAEIIAKSAVLVRLQGMGYNGVPADSLQGAAIKSNAVLLPEDAQLGARASLLFEPGTNAPGQMFLLHQEDSVRKVRLGHVAEWIDGWQRVEFDWLD